MAEKIKIAELDLDINALIRSTSDVKKAIDDIKKQQKELAAQGETSSNQFVQNAADLKTLQSAYNSNLKAIQESTQATADQANRSQLLAIALNTEATSIKEARDQNSLLNKLRNEANATTEEGQKEIAALNKKLDENNEFIKANADAYLQQKINIGNYKDSIIEAFDELAKNRKELEQQKESLEELKKEQEKGSKEWNYYNTQLNQVNQQIIIVENSMSGLNNEATASATISKLLSGNFSELAKDAKELGGAGNLVSSTLKGVVSGIWATVKASLAFIATPIGAILAAIAVVVGLLYSAFKSFTPLVDKVEQAFAALSAVMSVIKNTIIAVVTGTKSLGEAFSSLGGDMAEAAQAAANLKKAQQDLADAMEAQEIASAKARAEINRLTIQAKDRTKSEEERLALLKKAEELEKGDFERRAELAKQAIDNAKEDLRINAQLSAEELKLLDTNYERAKEIAEAKTGNVDDYFEAYKDAVLKQAEIDNEATSNIEKNINRQNKLIEDAEAKRQKAIEDAQRKAEEAEARRQKILEDTATKAQLELDLFLASQGIKAKSVGDELSLASQVYQKKLEINQKEFEASEKTANDKLLLQVKNNDALNELLLAQQNVVVANAENELKLFIDNNKSKLDANKFLTDEMVAEEKRRNELILQEQLEFEALKLEQGTITTEAYNQRINELNEANRLTNDELDNERKLAKQEQDIVDWENQMAINEMLFGKTLDARLMQLEKEKQAEIKNAEKTGADLTMINAKYALIEKKMRADLEATKLATTADALSQAKGLFKEHTAAYKVLAIAEATINTYKAASMALSTYAYPIGGIFAALAIAQGLMQVSQIAGVKFEKGGIQEVGGKRHSQGGTKFYGEDGTMFEAEAGEGIGVLNRSAFASFMDFNNRFGSGVSTPTFMQGGGVITQAVKTNSVDTNALAQVTIDAVRNMPNPIVAVEDINRGQNNYAEVVNGADN